MSVRLKEKPPTDSPLRAEHSLAQLDDALVVWRGQLVKLLARGLPTREGEALSRIAALTALIQGADLLRELLTEEARGA